MELLSLGKVLCPLSADVKLVDVEEVRGEVMSAVREARVNVEVNGQIVALNAALYHLPLTHLHVRVDDGNRGPK